jgi:hypothetical protein
MASPGEGFDVLPPNLAGRGSTLQFFMHIFPRKVGVCDFTNGKESAIIYATKNEYLGGI